MSFFSATRRGDCIQKTKFDGTAEQSEAQHRETDATAPQESLLVVDATQAATAFASARVSSSHRSDGFDREETRRQWQRRHRDFNSDELGLPIVFLDRRKTDDFAPFDGRAFVEKML